MSESRQHDVFHPGELEAHRRFGVKDYWDHHTPGFIRDRIPEGWALFLEEQPFFFMATANLKGECDCSFRGREFNASGQAYPLLKVLDPKTLVFPDFSGNKLYNSLGNILDNPHIGMLFVDFQNRTRARVNGRATILEDKAAYAHIWPQALRYVKVEVTQAYPNCKARVPKMNPVSWSDIMLDE